MTSASSLARCLSGCQAAAASEVASEATGSHFNDSDLVAQSFTYSHSCHRQGDNQCASKLLAVGRFVPLSKGERPLPLPFPPPSAPLPPPLRLPLRQLANEVAGPAVILSYVVAGISALLSAFCYTEFAIQVAGSCCLAGEGEGEGGCVAGWMAGWLDGWMACLWH